MLVMDSKRIYDIEEQAVENEPQFTLQVKNVSVEARSKSASRTVLNKVNASFKSNELSVIMGKSGSGKSTLLNVLTGNAKVASGAVQVNHENISQSLRGFYAYIPQDDLLFPGLTPRQTLHYAFRLCTKVDSFETLNSKVEAKLKQLGLTTCSNTPIGDGLVKGISGGERKRLSLGVDLLLDRRIFLVDEPTSGLDSKLALDIVQLLKETALRNRIVVAVIHQPSNDVFRQFDNLLLLNKGSVVYQGKPGGVLSFFQNKLKWSIPSNVEAINFIIEKVQSEETDLHVVWDSNKGAEHLISKSEQLNILHSKPYRAPVITQIYIHGLRTFRDNIGDKNKFQLRIVRKLTIYLLLGIVFVGQSNGTNPSAFTSTSALFVIAFILVDENMVNSVTQYPIFLPYIIREFRNGTTYLFPYVSTQMICTIVIDIIFALFVIPAYFLVGFSKEKFLVFFSIVPLSIGFSTATGLLIGAYVADIRSALRIIFPFFIPQVLYCGYLVPVTEIPSAFLWLHDISYITYMLNSALLNEFQDVLFTDCPKSNNSQSDSCYASGQDYLESYGLEGNSLRRNLIILLIYTIITIIVCIFLISTIILMKSRAI